MGSKAIYIYTRSGCDESQSLKEYLSADQIPYHEIDISHSNDLESELLGITGTNITPAIIVDKKSMFGKKKRAVFSGYVTNKSTINRVIH
ncbi:MULTISPECIES: glutaredoxin family protein [Pontibacillus]|uniref:Glutaredoxin n=1 Tax=Pontibacillus chungwhensis TaxID=265426 RepID=A0ABY8UVL3_9BACI|nr:MULTISPECIES: glutaredoxin [Pontibacillus]MCD5325211.1 glutaredoxin [Pontibacillus sp. HN14]WIF97458.1 glutaredoxin [Pontibacillus chungwhensis]